jgi:homoserine O-acetyltransferase
MTTLSTQSSSAADFLLGDFTTGAGGVLRDAVLRYRIFGTPALGRERGWTVVFHALTGSHNLDQWWGPLLEPGRPLDPAQGPVLAINLLGSCYGSSSPAPGTRWAGHFPELSTEDLARAHVPLLEHLGVERVTLATGGSLGGMVALQWARIASVPTDRVVVFAAPARTSAQAIGWNAAQRMAIEADAGWRGGHYPPGAGPTAGLAAARAIAMITYRSGAEFAERFGRQRNGEPDRFAVESYLRRQGDKLVARFDAASYLSLMRSMDLHDVGEIHAAARQTAERVGLLIGVGIDSDILYAPAEVRTWVDAYQAGGARTAYREITSRYGHDAFLIEWDQVSEILSREW